MKIGTFIGILFNNLNTYALLAIVVFIIYYILFHRYIFSIFDPMFFGNIIPSAFATTTVLFLIVMKKIEIIYLYNYMITLFSFYSFFFLYGKKIPKEASMKFTIKHYKNTYQNLYYSSMDYLGSYFWIFFVILSSFNVLIQVFFYVKTGIPLFMDSRLTVQMNGGAVIGVLTRLKYFLEPVTTFMSFFLLYSSKSKQRFIAKSYVLYLIVVGFFSGSKSGIINYIFIFSLFIFYTQKTNKKWVYRISNPKSIIVLFFGGIFVLAIIHIQQKGDFIGTLNHLILRFAAYGDGYVYAYPNNTINMVYKPGLLKFIFGDFLYTFRLLNGRPIGFGFELSNIVYNVTNSITGPNPRFNLVGYAYFGFWGSILLSLISGALFTFGRNILISALNKNPSYIIFAYFISGLVTSIESDICNVISNITTNLFLQIMFFIFIYFFLIYLVPKKNKLCTSIL